MVHPDVESFILEHANVPVYDPQKAHEYYLRTRELKGRHPGLVKTTSGRPSAKTTAPIKKVAQKNQPNHAEQLRKRAEAKVAALKSRLAKLEKVLAELKKQAKARSGVKTPTKSTPALSSNSKTTHTKPLTAAQKKEAAKKAKERRDKERDPSLSVQTKNLEDQIKRVEARIKTMKATIAAAKAKVHGKSQTNGTKGR